MSLPSDPQILLSVINTKLRDMYASLDALCEEEDLPKDEIVASLKACGYTYDVNANRFRSTLRQ